MTLEELRQKLDEWYYSDQGLSSKKKGLLVLAVDAIAASQSADAKMDHLLAALNCKTVDEAIERVEMLRDTLEGYATCSDGCTCGDGWNHDAATAALKVITPPQPASQEGGEILSSCPSCGKPSLREWRSSREHPMWWECDECGRRFDPCKGCRKPATRVDAAGNVLCDQCGIQEGGAKCQGE